MVLKQKDLGNLKTLENIEMVRRRVNIHKNVCNYAKSEWTSNVCYLWRVAWDPENPSR